MLCGKDLERAELGKFGKMLVMKKEDNRLFLHTLREFENKDIKIERIKIVTNFEKVPCQIYQLF